MIITHASGHSAARLAARFRELGILVFLLIFVAIVIVTQPRFLVPTNLRSIVLDIPLLLLIALGQTIVIISRNIDLSVGSILGFTGMAVGLMFKSNPEFPVLLGIGIGILLGALLGTINGVLVGWLKVPAIITTLGTLSIYRGGAFIISNGRQIDPNDVPVDLIRLTQTSPIGIPWLVIIALGLALAAAFFLQFTRTGREVYAIGSNPDAARLRGVRVQRTTALVFVISGALSGLAGVMYASRFGFVNPGETGVGFELSVIAATVIGGTNVFGGSGTVFGTFVGCLLLSVINNGLAVMHVSAFWLLAVYGMVILLAVIVDALIHRRLQTVTVGVKA